MNELNFTRVVLFLRPALAHERLILHRERDRDKDRDRQAGRQTDRDRQTDRRIND